MTSFPASMIRGWHKKLALASRSERPFGQTNDFAFKPHCAIASRQTEARFVREKHDAYRSNVPSGGGPVASTRRYR